MNAVQELSGATPLVNRLTGGVDEFFGRTDSGGTTFPLTDALGSTIALTDSSGAIQTQYTYEPFGATTPTGATSSNWYQFTGRENDSTGLYYYRARYYSPRFQRFISEDPLGFGGGDSNLYGYVREGPTNFADPGGNTPVYSLPGSAALPTSGRKDKCYTLSCYAKNIGIGAAEGLAFGGPLAFAAAEAADAAAAGADDWEAYQQYWESKSGRAPVRSSPYNVVPQYYWNGNMTGATTYDEYGNRAYQYEFDPSTRHGPGYHSYDNSGPYLPTGNGPRSPHIVF